SANQNPAKTGNTLAMRTIPLKSDFKSESNVDFSTFLPDCDEDLFTLFTSSVVFTQKNIHPSILFNDYNCITDLNLTQANIIHSSAMIVLEIFMNIWHFRPFWETRIATAYRR